MMLYKILFCVIVTVETNDRPAGLYTNNDNVVVLNDTNFHDTISGQSHAWLVEFYASWCGYCRNFAPVFKQFANEVSDWGDVIRVAVIDCGDDINAEKICKDANLTGYPTLKYYFPFTITKDGDVGYNRVSHIHTGEALLIDTIDFVEQMVEEMVEINPKIKHLWPNLTPLSGEGNATNLGFYDIWPEYNEDTFVVIEHEASYIGRQIILDFWRRSEPHVVIERLVVSSENVDTVLEKLRMASLPTVAVFNSVNQTVTPLEIVHTNSADIKSSLETSIQNYLNIDIKEYFAQSTLNPVNNLNGGTSDEGDIIRRRYTVYLSDLDKTVLSSLRQEILLRNTFTSDQDAAFHQYLNILHQFYYKQSDVFELISKLKDMVDDERSFPANLSDMLEQKSADTWDWVGCQGSRAKYGGYTCGLWSLWHYLTVAQLEAGSGDPRDVLRSMVSYVREFFGCRECSEHFLEMVANGSNIETEVTSYEDAVLYLWNRHNDVTKRLIDSDDDNTDDPLFPRHVFPSKAFCPSCFRGEENHVVKGNILTFLKKHYSKSSLILQSTAYSSSKMNLYEIPLHLLMTVILFF